MKKIILSLILVVFVIGLIGCTQMEKKTTTTKKTSVSTTINTSDVDSSVAEIDSIDDDLNTSELDEIDSMLKELES